MRSRFIIILLVVAFSLPLTGCEDTDVRLAAEAGLDAVKAITLSDEAVRNLAREASLYTDGKNSIAPEGSPSARRLRRLVGEYGQEEGVRFAYKVYLSPVINAFAMADGTIRIYSGLMDMLDDDELRFVVGHEMGHVVREHIRKKMQLALAGRAVRKGIASQNSLAGAIARSELGWFVEKLTSAQFSQQEEREADDFGLSFLIDKGYPPEAALSALRKLATLGNEHSFLSSHPAPEARAVRLEQVLRGDAAGEPGQSRVSGAVASLKILVLDLIDKMLDLVKGLLQGSVSS